MTGRLRRGRDAFDLLAASFPGGSITGAPKIRAMEILEGLEPVRRGPYTGALGWIGPDGAMQTSILIRTFVADGRRLTLHVGGGITWGSDPAAEWEETVAKARGPLGAIGGEEVGVTPAGDRHAAATSGSTARSSRPTAPHLSVFDRGFQLGDGVFETLRARGGRPTELASPPRPAPSIGRRARHRAPDGRRRASWPRASRALLAADGLDGPDGDASIRITVSRGAYRGRGVLPARRGRAAPTIAIQAWPVVPAPADHLERGLHLVTSRRPTRPAEPAGHAQDHVACRVRLRAARGAPRRRRRCAVPDDRRPPLGGRRRPTSSWFVARR